MRITFAARVQHFVERASAPVDAATVALALGKYITASQAARFAEKELRCGKRRDGRVGVVRSALWKLHKQGRIRRVGRGLYWRVAHDKARSA